MFRFESPSIHSQTKLDSFHPFHQAMSFLFYGFLMFLDILLFIVLAYFYKPRTPSGVSEEDKEVLELRNSGESLDNNNLAN